MDSMAKLSELQEYSIQLPITSEMRSMSNVPAQHGAMVVEAYLELQGLTIDRAACYWRNPLEKDVIADVVLSGLGRLECIVVQNGEPKISLIDANYDRLGYVIVVIADKTIAITGFAENPDLVLLRSTGEDHNPVPQQIDLNNLMSIDEWMAWLGQMQPIDLLSSYIFPSGVGMWAMPETSGLNISETVRGASMPPERSRKFWLIADAELIVYGATAMDATLYVDREPIKLNSDGTFRFQMSFQDGHIRFPIFAIAADGEQNRAIHMDFERETLERRTNTKEEEQFVMLTTSDGSICSGSMEMEMPTTSGLKISETGRSTSMPPERSRKFWLIADVELIVYGATEPDATVYIDGEPIKLNSDGTFRFQMSFQDGSLRFPILAVAADGEQNRAIHMNFERQTLKRRTNTKKKAKLEWMPY
jgi:Protein of unknown function (DUF1822)